MRYKWFPGADGAKEEDFDNHWAITGIPCMIDDVSLKIVCSIRLCSGFVMSLGQLPHVRWMHAASCTSGRQKRSIAVWLYGNMVAMSGRLVLHCDASSRRSALYWCVHVHGKLMHLHCK